MILHQSPDKDNSFERILNFGLMFACDSGSKSSSFSIDMLSQSPTIKEIQKFATNYRKYLEKTIKTIKLPKYFSAKEIASEILHQSNFNLFTRKNDMEKTPIKLTKKDKELLKITFFIKKFQSRTNLTLENNEELATLVPLFETLQSLMHKNLKKFLSYIENKQQRIDHQFLHSDFPAAFNRILNNSLNILKTYYLYYLTSFPNLGKLFSDVFWEKITKESLEEQYLFFTLQPLFNQYQYQLNCELFKIDLYIKAWHAKDFESLFSQPEQNLSLSNLNKKYFLSLLNTCEKLNKEFYSLLADVAKAERKNLPFAFELNDKDESENLKFLSQIFT